MKTIRVSELTGAALDWAVAKCEGYQAVFTAGSLRPVFRKCEAVENTWPSYSTDWKQGGPIIEREKISLIMQASLGNHWTASRPSSSPIGFKTIEEGPTPLIAAMRCYVASKLGDEVEIPKELTPC